jgi:hypothetical protein
MQFSKHCLNPHNLNRTSAIALYYASVRYCLAFLAHHEIKFGPKKIAKPWVDFLSSLHPAQSASENALIMVDEDHRMRIDMSILSFRKHKIRLTTVR